MHSKITIHNIPYGTEAWHEFRVNGIGGSEVGTVLGINKYDTALRLFHEKIGNIPSRREDSERMFWGRNIEDNIAETWKYYDGTKDGYVENSNNNKIIRTCRNVNGYAVHADYPWLFASVDRLINIKGGFNLITGEPLEKEAILECKNMSYWVSKMWEDGIPIYHLGQVHQYFIVFEADYSEIAMLIDGGNFRVEKIQRDEGLIDRILSITKSFWYDRVLPAREARIKRDAADARGDIKEAERCEAIIQSLEPDPDGSDGYTDFMNDKFVEERESVDGTMALYELGKNDRFFKGIINRLESERVLIKNIFVKFLTQHGSETVDFGKLGKVNWSMRKGSSSRTFNNRIKDKPDEDLIEEEFNKLNPHNFR